MRDDPPPNLQPLLSKKMKKQQYAANYFRVCILRVSLIPESENPELAHPIYQSLLKFEWFGFGYGNKCNPQKNEIAFRFN